MKKTETNNADEVQLELDFDSPVRERPNSTSQSTGITTPPARRFDDRPNSRRITLTLLTILFCMILNLYSVFIIIYVTPYTNTKEIER